MTSIAREGTGTRANSQDMFIIIIIIIPLLLVGSGQVSLNGVFSVSVSGLAAWNGLSYRGEWRGCHATHEKQVILRVLRHADPALFKTARDPFSLMHRRPVSQIK